MWELVLVESPYWHSNPLEVIKNVDYLKLCILDCLKRGEFPYASHLFFTQVLDDNNQDERQLGIDAWLAWGAKADKTVIYTDRGISRWMEYGLEHAKKLGRKIEYRTLDKESLSTLNTED